MCARVNRRVLRGLSLFDGHIVHLTHTDLDAVCCDALFKRKYGNVFTIFSSVQDYISYLELLAQAEKTANLTLCLSDLGGRTSALEVVARLKNKGWRIEWRDHHVWDERFFEDIKSVIDYLRVDRELCACEIVYTDLLDGDLIAKEIAAMGRDRDFWINNDPRSEVLSTAITDDKSEIEAMYTLQIGRKSEAISKAIQKSVLLGSTAVTTSSGYTSDVAARLRDKYHSTTEIILRRNGVFSIRTVAPVSNQIAMLFNGGGHPHAAGGNLSFTRRDQIGFRLFGYRLAKVRKLIEAASRFDHS
jgi:oligoribonuclease NrnB/cAMP/cGMP phosphodiesterase (DHH superfamily)